MNTEHKMVPVEYSGLSALIDEGIAPLIRELWKAGIVTLMSCEENRPGWMWIDFAHVTAAEHFVSIVARYETGIESLYNRIRGEWEPLTGDLVGKWQYAVSPMDVAVEESETDGHIEEACVGPSVFLFTLSIRFPKADYSTVLARMREHNRKTRAEMRRRARR